MEKFKQILSTFFLKINDGFNNIINKISNTFYSKFPKLKPKDDGPASPIKVYSIIGATILVLVLITLPKILEDNSLKKMGYSQLAITNMRNANQHKKIKNYKIYSSTLNTNYENNLTMDSQYLPLYTISSNVDETMILYYKKLVVLGYEQSDILEILSSLKDYEITVLLTLPKQDDVTIFIDDCKAHSDNSATSFTLSNSYYTPNDEATSNPSDSSNVNMLVNKRNYLSSDYVPQDLSEVSIRYASSGVSLAQQAIDALIEMTNTYDSLGIETGFYVSSGYRDYASQQEVYSNYESAYGDQANYHAAKAGFSEHQTGLAFDLATSASGIEFKESAEFTWLSQNCYDYGFILRYPQGKEYITGIDYEPWHYRYVGKDIALAVKESGLAYEEYYELYLRALPENINELIDNNQKQAASQQKQTVSESATSSPVVTQQPVETTPSTTSDSNE